MGGATAGSLMLKLPDKKNKINTMVISINNDCNLSCSHCYLGYNNSNKYINSEILDSIFDNEFQSLSIIAKEPLYDETSRKILSDIAIRCEKSGIYFGFITNGINLHLLSEETYKRCNFIDVSLHSLVYPNSIITSKIIENISHLSKKYPNKFNILTVLTKENDDEFEDIISLVKNLPIKNLIVSPFLLTDRIEPYALNLYRLQELMERLSKSSSFIEMENSLALIDSYHSYFDNIDISKIEDLAKKRDLDEKVRIYKTDPFDMGMIRINYDGTIMHPLNALNNVEYIKKDVLNIITHSINNENIFR